MKKIVLLAFLVPVFLIGLAAYKLKRGRGAVSQKEQSSISKWSANTFVSSEAFDFSKLKPTLEYQVGMDVLQKDGLQQCVSNFLTCFAVNSFDRFMQFRFPVTPNGQNSEWDIKALKGINELLSLSFPENQLSENSLKIYEAFYRAALSAKGLSVNGESLSFCRGCIVQFSPNSIAFQTASDRLGAHSLSDSINKSSESPTKTLFYSIHKYNLFKDRNATLKTCTVYVIVKTNESENAFPIYLVVGWDPQNMKWLPYELGMGLSDNKTPNLFF